MWSVIWRRALVAVGVVAGVVLLTFLLFRVAAGDPAAALLGRNPKASEVEALRREMGTDLPLFYGHWRGSDVYSQADFTAGGLPNGVSQAGGEAVFRRNFEVPEAIAAEVVRSHGSEWFELPEAPEEWRLPLTDGDGELLRVRFFRHQESGFHSQFVQALGEIVRFSPQFPYVKFLQFGRTLMTREEISTILLDRVGPSLALLLPIFAGEMLVGILLALIAAAAKDTWIDRLLLFLSVAGLSVSYLVVIMFGQWYLGYRLNWFPVWGWGGIEYLILPVSIGIACGLGGAVRFYRTVFVNELSSEYLRTAAAKGVAPWRIYGVHLLRNAAIPIISRAAATLPFLFTGSLLLETFFGIPGLGAAGVDALQNSDLQLLKALVIVSAIIFVVLNFIADIAYLWADPRLRARH